MIRMAVGVGMLLALLAGCGASTESKLGPHEVTYTLTGKGSFSSVEIFYTEGDGGDAVATLAGPDRTWSKELTTAETTVVLNFMAVPRDVAIGSAFTCVVAVDGVETRRTGSYGCSLTVDLLAA